VRNQNSTRIRGDADYIGVGKTNNTSIMCGQENDRALPAAKTCDDLLIKVGIRDESRPHVLGA